MFSSWKLGCTILFFLTIGLGPVLAQGDSDPIRHTVQPNETLYRIAVLYGVTVGDILRANDLTDPDRITVGQSLIIPAAAPLAVGQMSAPGGSGLQHTVAQGENLLRIAEQYGVTVEGLMAANSLMETSLICVGQVLDIPVESLAPDLLTVVSESGETILALPDSGGVLETPVDAAINTLTQLDPTPADEETTALLPPDIDWQAFAGFATPGSPDMREVYLRGQALGNNPHAFSKIGDCNSEAPFFLAKFDTSEYDLGPYFYLQPAVDHFAASFGRQSLAVWTGSHAWAVLDADWANPAYCQTQETPIACEFRLNRPSIVLVRMGTNEVGTPKLFEESLRQIVQFSLERGVIPILGTKADRLEGDDSINDIIRTVAQEFGVPLWDFGRAVELIQGRGLRSDGFHLTYFAPRYSDALAYKSGHSIQNLTALVALDAVWRSVMY